MQARDHSAHDVPPEAAAARTTLCSRWVFGGFAALALLALAVEHRMHLSGLLGWLPYLILLACPLMHLFMHGGHGHGVHANKPESDGQK
jgi:hypothetical protein